MQGVRRNGVGDEEHASSQSRKRFGSEVVDELDWGEGALFGIGPGLLDCVVFLFLSPS